MSALIARCPKTNLAINTGIASDFKSLAKSWKKSVTVGCPHCNEEHTIKVRETFVSSEVSEFRLGRQ